MFYLFEVDFFQVILRLHIKCIYAFYRRVQIKCIWEINTVGSKGRGVSLSSGYANDSINFIFAQIRISKSIFRVTIVVI